MAPPVYFDEKRYSYHVFAPPVQHFVDYQHRGVVFGAVLFDLFPRNRDGGDAALGGILNPLQQPTFVGALEKASGEVV